MKDQCPGQKIKFKIAKIENDEKGRWDTCAFKTVPLASEKIYSRLDPIPLIVEDPPSPNRVCQNFGKDYAFKDEDNSCNHSISSFLESSR